MKNTYFDEFDFFIKKWIILEKKGRGLLTMEEKPFVTTKEEKKKIDVCKLYAYLYDPDTQYKTRNDFRVLPKSAARAMDYIVECYRTFGIDLSTVPHGNNYPLLYICAFDNQFPDALTFDIDDPGDRARLVVKVKDNVDQFYRVSSSIKAKKQNSEEQNVR